MPLSLTHNTLPETARIQSIALLNRHLAAAIDLHGQVKQSHWNVRGPGFFAMHQLFDKVAGDVEDMSDSLAERAGNLGGAAAGTIQVAAANSYLVAHKLGISDEKSHAFAIASGLAAFGQSVRDAIGQAAGFGDPGTADLFTELLRKIDQLLWFVESHFVRA